MLSLALSGLQDSAFLSVDDVRVFGSNLKDHNEKLVKILEMSHNLKLNPKKCNFLKPEVVYLGHLITAEGLRTDPNKSQSKTTQYPRTLMKLGDLLHSAIIIDRLFKTLQN